MSSSKKTKAVLKENVVRGKSKPATPAPQTDNDLNYHGSEKCAAHLGFRTQNDFYDYLESPAFEPYYLTYERWKEEHNLKQQPVKPYLTTLDSIVRKKPEERGPLEEELATGKPAATWSPHHYVLSTMLQIHFASCTVEQTHSVGHEFPLELPGARWRKLWNVFRFCTIKKYFDMEERRKLRARRDLDKILGVPTYMKPPTDDIKVAPPTSGEQVDDDPEHFITWENMPEQDGKSGLDARQTLQVPPLHSFDCINTFQTWASTSFQLDERGLEITSMKSLLEHGPMKFKSKRNLEPQWEDIFGYDSDGYSLNFFCWTKDVDATSKKTELEHGIAQIPAALQDAYYVNSKGAVEELEQESDYEVDVWWQHHQTFWASNRKRKKDMDEADSSHNRAGKQARTKPADTDEDNTAETPLFEQEVFKGAELALPAVDPDAVMQDGEEPASDIAATESVTEPDTVDDNFDEEADTGPERESESDDGLGVSDVPKSPEYSDYEPEGGLLSDGSGKDEEYGYPKEFEKAPISEKPSSQDASSNSTPASLIRTTSNARDTQHSPPSHVDYVGMKGKRSRRPVRCSPSAHNAELNEDSGYHADSEMTDEHVHEPVAEVESAEAIKLTDLDVKSAEVDPQNRLRFASGDDEIGHTSTKTKISVKKLRSFLEKIDYPIEEVPEAIASLSGRRNFQSRITEILQVATDCPFGEYEAEPSQDTLDSSTAIANMRLSGKYFENEEDVEKFMSNFYQDQQVWSGVDEANVGPDVLLSKEVLGANEDGHPPNMKGWQPSAAQYTAAAWLWAKEQCDGQIVSNDGKRSYRTLPSEGGMLTDAPGLGKTLASIMLIQTGVNNLKPGVAGKSTLVIAPRITLLQWYITIRICAPGLKVFIYWGDKNSYKESWWHEVHIPLIDMAKGPENLPQHLRYLAEGGADAEASVIMITPQSAEKRFRPPKSSKGFKNFFGRIIIDEAHCIKDPNTSTWKVLHALNCPKRILITATPMINDKTDIIGLATFLFRPKWASRYEEDFDVFNEDIALDDPRVVAALDKKNILKAFESLPSCSGEKTKACQVQELAALRKIMPKILLPFQLRRAYGTRLQVGDGSTVRIGVEIPIYTTKTIDLRMEPLAQREYSIIHNAIVTDYEKRRKLFAATKKKQRNVDEPHFPFPFDLQRKLEVSSSSTRIKRFMDDLPPHATLVPGLAVMEEHKLDYRFFVDMSIRDDDHKPRTREQHLKLMVDGSPKARWLLKLLKRHIIQAKEKKVLVFCQNPITGKFLEWLLKAIFYRVVFFDSNMTAKRREEVVKDFNTAESELEILISTYRIGSEGVDLQNECSTVILFEAACNTNTEIQAIGRIRRRGQQKEQVVYRLFTEDTFNGYQEIKSLQKRMGEMATWGGDDVQEAFAKFMPELGDDLHGDQKYLECLLRFDRHIKGQTREVNDTAAASPFERLTEMRALKEQLRKDARVV